MIAGIPPSTVVLGVLKEGQFVVRTCDLDLEIVLEKRLHESNIKYYLISVGFQIQTIAVQLFGKVGSFKTS